MRILYIPQKNKTNCQKISLKYLNKSLQMKNPKRKIYMITIKIMFKDAISVNEIEKSLGAEEDARYLLAVLTHLKILLAFLLHLKISYFNIDFRENYGKVLIILFFIKLIFFKKIFFNYFQMLQILLNKFQLPQKKFDLFLLNFKYKKSLKNLCTIYFKFYI